MKNKKVVKYLMEIKPAIPPADRHQLQDTLKKLGYHVIGGGSCVDGSFSDVSFEKEEG